jgi:carboxymethylenebutenolidase
MTDLERYILDEWTDDYRSGRLVRREFLRRIAVFSGGAVAGLTVLASRGFPASPEEVAEAAASPAPLRAQATAGVTVPPDDPAIDARMVSFPLGSTAILAYAAFPRSTPKAPAVTVVHENRGLVEHIKDVCRRLAKAGYAGLAIDLMSPQGGTEKFADSAEVSTYLSKTPPERHVEILNAGVRYLQQLPAVRADRVGTMGFCFGGGMVWRLATQNADLRAAAPFYGPNPPLEEVAKIRAAVLAFYGSLDTFVTPGLAAMRNALEKAGVTFETHLYEGANHGFFNDTGAQYNAAAAKDAWTRTLAWFGRWLA